MARERIIWCPNEIPSEEWEAMSRADQTKWWKDHRDEMPYTKPHMKETVELYNEGCITQMEFCSVVAKLVVPEEIEDFFQACPLDLVAILKESLASYGDDETKWPRTFSIASYAPWVTAEEIKESQRQEQEQIWSGVRILKDYFRGRSEK
jgi:hypothetical protein